MNKRCVADTPALSDCFLKIFGILAEKDDVCRRNNNHESK